MDNLNWIVSVRIQCNELREQRDHELLLGGGIYTCNNTHEDGGFNDVKQGGSAHPHAH